MEEYSDDEYDIFQNKKIANAYMAAKKKVLQKTIKEHQYRLATKTGSPERL